MTSTPNTKYYTVAHAVPRDLDAYAPTTHFLQRKKYRSDPEIETSIIREVLAEGRCSGNPTHIPEVAQDAGDVFTFERTVRTEGERHHFTVVVAVSEAAFRSDTPHQLLTVYADAHFEDGGGPDA